MTLHLDEMFAITPEGLVRAKRTHWKVEARAQSQQSGRVPFCSGVHGPRPGWPCCASLFHRTFSKR